jgi:hypothetical protein
LNGKVEGDLRHKKAQKAQKAQNRKTDFGVDERPSFVPFCG